MSESSRKILSDNNVSITNPRILVLEALMESQNPQTIDDLQNRLGNKVAKSTLYRVLGDLKKINVLHEFTSLTTQQLLSYYFMTLIIIITYSVAIVVRLLMLV